MFFSKKLLKFKNLRHCFFSRNNGVSKGFYESLNCGLGSDDSKKNVLKNLELVGKKIKCKSELLITLNQTHSNNVIFFNSMDSIKNKLKGDAIVTKVKNIGISILTADCVPILLYDPKNSIIGCIHSGWKGALNGVIENTIKNYEPRVKLLKTRVSPNPDSYEFDVIITYQIIGIDAQAQQLSFALQPTR